MVAPALCAIPDALARRKHDTALTSRQEDTATLKHHFPRPDFAFGSTPPSSTISFVICRTMIEHMPMIGGENDYSPGLTCLAQ